MTTSKLPVPPALPRISTPSWFAATLASTPEAPVVVSDVPVAAPMFGVTSVGVFANTSAPEPVSSEITPASSADVVAANTLNLLAVYATVPPAPNAIELASVPVKVSVLLAVNVLPSAIVNVALDAGAVNATLLIDVAVAAPSVGVTNVGLVANTNEPVPVSSVTAASKLALDGVPKNVATPVPKLVIPVPPLATGRVPVTPVDSGRPVQFDSVPLVGVPSIGVTNVGVFANTSAPVPVSSLITPASSADVVAANALSLLVVYVTVPPAPNATELASVPVKVSVLLAVNVLPSAMVNVEPVAGAVNATLLIDVAVATPSAGVTNVGVFANTSAPEPVSSEITPASCADVVAANCAKLPPVVAIPVMLPVEPLTDSTPVFVITGVDPSPVAVPTVIPLPEVILAT